MKNYLYIGALLLIVYLFFNSKSKGKKITIAQAKGNRMMKNYTEADGTNALLKIAMIVPKERAQLLERIMRFETGHFTSKQYKQTGSAGMEEGKWSNLPPHTTIPFKDNHDGHIGNFIVWNSVYDFLVYLNNYIDKYGGNFARWNTTNPIKQKIYASKVNAVKNRTIV